SSPVNVEDPDLLAEVRQAVAQFGSAADAIAAGYAADDHCVAHPDLGAMGHHYVNNALVDPTFEITRPEALLFAPTDTGGLRLVGVEYIVIDAGQPRPDFDGHAFDVGGVP